MRYRRLIYLANALHLVIQFLNIYKGGDQLTLLADLRVGCVPKAFQPNALHLVGFYHSHLLIQASLIRSLK